MLISTLCWMDMPCVFQKFCTTRIYVNGSFSLLKLLAVESHLMKSWKIYSILSSGESVMKLSSKKE